MWSGSLLEQSLVEFFAYACEHLREIETIYENTSAYEKQAKRVRLEKNQGKQSRDTVPLRHRIPHL